MRPRADNKIFFIYELFIIVTGKICDLFSFRKEKESYLQTYIGDILEYFSTFLDKNSSLIFYSCFFRKCFS